MEYLRKILRRTPRACAPFPGSAAAPERVGGRGIDDEAKGAPNRSACILLQAEMAEFEYQSVKAQSFLLKLQSFSLNSEMILLGGESLSEQAECFLPGVESFLLEVRAQALKGEYFGLERDIRKVTR